MNRASLGRLAHAGLVSLVVAALGACSAESPSTPTLEKPLLGYIPGPGGTPVLSASNAIVPEMIKVCKAYSGAVGAAVQIRVQVDSANDGPGSGDEDFIVTVANGECWEVWSTDSNANVITDNVTFTETVPAGYTASYVLQTRENGAVITNASVASNTGSVLVTNPGNPVGFDGVVWTFTNTEIVTPPDGCTLTQGYWKNHSSGRKDAWPVASLTIGGIVYTKAELVAIMQAPTAGNGLMSLVQQLIAAKLNVIEGASSVDIADEIAAADLLIDNAGGKIAIGPPSSPFIAPATSSALNNALTAFNEGRAGVDHCED